MTVVLDLSVVMLPASSISVFRMTLAKVSVIVLSLVYHERRCLVGVNTSCCSLLGIFLVSLPECHHLMPFCYQMMPFLSFSTLSQSGGVSSKVLGLSSKGQTL